MEILTFFISKIVLPKSRNFELNQNFERQIGKIRRVYTVIYMYMSREEAENTIKKAIKFKHEVYPGGEEGDVMIKDSSLEDIQLTSDEEEEEEEDQVESPILEKKREDSSESEVSPSFDEDKYGVKKKKFSKFYIDPNYRPDEEYEEEIEDIEEFEEEDEIKIGTEEDAMIENQVMDSTLKSGSLWVASLFLPAIMVSLFFGLIPMGDPNNFLSSWKTSVIVYPICGLVLSYVAYSHFLTFVQMSSPLKPKIWAILIVFLFVLISTNIFVVLFGWFPIIGLIEIVASILGTKFLILLFEGRNFDGELSVRFYKGYRNHIYLLGATIFGTILAALYLIWFANVKVVGQSVLPILLIFLSMITRKVVNVVVDKKDTMNRIISLFFVTNGIDNLYLLSLLSLSSAYTMISIAMAYMITQIICLLQTSTIYWGIRQRVISLLIPSRYQMPLNYTKDYGKYSIHKSIELMVMIISQIISMSFFLVLSITMRISWNRPSFPFSTLEDHIFHAMVLFLSLYLLLMVFSSIFHYYWIRKFSSDILIEIYKIIFKVMYSNSTAILVSGIIATWQIITSLTLLYHSRIWYLVK